jgi:hypothetical protein
MLLTSAPITIVMDARIWTQCLVTCKFLRSQLLSFAFTLSIFLLQVVSPESSTLPTRIMHSVLTLILAGIVAGITIQLVECIENPGKY